MSLMKNFRELYILPDEKSKEWDDKIFEYGEAGDVEKLEEHLHTANELYLEERQIYTAINMFTLNTESEEKKKRLLDNLKEEEYIEKLTYTDTIIKMKIQDGKEIRAIKLSGMIPNLNEEDPDIETQKRKGNCHSKAIDISLSMGIPNEVVTGYIFGYSDKAKYLHSWVEFCDRDEELVLDYTLNIIMNKEGYYFMQHAIPLNRVLGENINEDKKYIKQFGKLGYFSDKEYLLYRDEIIRDFKKNIKLFSEER